MRATIDKSMHRLSVPPARSQCQSADRDQSTRWHVEFFLIILRSMVQSIKSSTPTEVLAGLIDRVTFHNAENGFCVLRVKARGQRDLITVLGHAPMISAGEFVQASGIWINDRTHGVQFRASFLKSAAPTTVEGIEKYLGSGMIRGIGPAYAKKLVRAFGESVLEVIQQEPGR